MQFTANLSDHSYAKPSHAQHHTHKHVFFFIPATCGSPQHVLQLSDLVRMVEIRESGFDETRMCCSGLLITRGDATACVENWEWEFETT